MNSQLNFFQALANKVSTEQTLAFQYPVVQQLTDDATTLKAFEAFFEAGANQTFDLLTPAVASQEEETLFLEAKVAFKLPVPAFEEALSIETVIISFDTVTKQVDHYFMTKVGETLPFFLSKEEDKVLLSTQYKLGVSNIHEIHEAFGFDELKENFQQFLNISSFFTEITIDDLEVLSSPGELHCIYDATPEKLQDIVLIPDKLVLKDLFFTTELKQERQFDDQYLTSHRIQVNATVELFGANYQFICRELGEERYELQIEKEEGLTLPTIPQLLAHFGLEVPSLEAFPEITINNIRIAIDVAQKSLIGIDINSNVLFKPLAIHVNTQLSFPNFSYSTSLNAPIRFSKVWSFLDKYTQVPLPVGLEGLAALQISKFDTKVSAAHQFFCLTLEDVFSFQFFGMPAEFEQFGFDIHHFTNQSTQIGIEGKFTFLGLDFEFGGSVAEHLELSGRVSTDKRLSDYQEPLEKAFNTTLPFSLPHLGLKEFQVEYNSAGSFMFSVALHDYSFQDLGIQLGLLKEVKIRNSKLQFTRSDQGAFHCEVSGAITLKEIDYQITFLGYHEQEKKGFIFSGELTNEYSLEELAYFSGYLQKVIPPSVKDLSLKQLNLNFNSIEQQLTFEAHIQNVLQYDFELGLLKQLSVDDCRFKFVASPTQLIFDLVGDLSINSTKLQLASKLSTESGLRLSARNKEVVQLNLKQLTEHFLGEIPIWKLVPSYFQQLDFNTLAINFQTSPLHAGLEIETKQLGALYGNIGQLSSSSVGVLVGLFPPSKIPFSQINKDLSFLEMLNFNGSFLILSSVNSSDIQDGLLPERLSAVQFVQGLTLSASLSLDSKGIQDEELRTSIEYFRQHILDIQNLTIVGMLGLDPEKIAIEGYIGKIALNGTTVEIKKAGLRFSAALDATIFGTISFDLEAFIGIKMSFSLYLKVSANGVTGYGIWEGDLGTRNVKELGRGLATLETNVSNMLDSYDASKNFIKGNEFFNSAAFQKLQALPDLQITKLGLILGISYQGVPSFGFIGEFTLNGDQKENGGVVAFVFDSANPSKCLLDLKFPKGVNKELKQLFHNFPLANIVYPQLSLFLQAVSFGGFYDEKKAWVPLRLKIAVMDVRIGDVFYNRGVLAQGRIGLFNDTFEGIFNLKIDNAGFKGFGKLKEVDIKLAQQQLLKISESEKTVKVKDKVLNENISKLQFKGPYIQLNAPIGDATNAQFSATAHIAFLGISRDLNCHISKDGFFFTLEDNYPTGHVIFDVRVAALTDMHAKFEITFNFELEELFISIQAECNGGLSFDGHELVAKLFTDIVFQNPVTRQMVTLPKIEAETKITTAEVKQLLLEVINIIKREVLNVGAKVFEGIRNVLEGILADMKRLERDLVQLAERLRKLLADKGVAEETIRQLIETIQLISNAIGDIEHNLRQLIGEIEQLGHQIANLAESIRQLDVRKAAAATQGISHIVINALIHVLRIVDSVNQINTHVLQMATNHYNNEWHRLERERDGAYHRRMQLAAERKKYWGDVVGNIKRLAEEGNLLTFEADCEHKKWHCSNIVNLIRPTLDTLKGLDHQLSQLRQQKSDCENRQRQFGNQRHQLQIRVDQEKAKKEAQEHKLVAQRVGLQGIETGMHQNKENEQRTRQQLADKRAELARIKEEYLNKTSA